MLEDRVTGLEREHEVARTEIRNLSSEQRHRIRPSDGNTNDTPLTDRNLRLELQLDDAIWRNCQLLKELAEAEETIAALRRAMDTSDR
jgi:hypothetical protein